MVIKGKVDGAVCRTDADRNRIVGIVASEIIIIKANHFPLPDRKLTTCNTDLAIAIVVTDVLVTGVRYHGILLERTAIDPFVESNCSESFIAQAQRFGVH